MELIYEAVTWDPNTSLMELPGRQWRIWELEIREIPPAEEPEGRRSPTLVLAGDQSPAGLLLSF